VLYLLDTNILSDLERNPSGSVAVRLAQVESLPDMVIATSIVVVCEARFGVRKRGSPALEQRVEQILAKISVLPLDGKVAEIYAEVRLELERKGQPIGANDLLIAAHALALDAVLVTDNVGEFGRVTGLRVENWLRS
jgi:tRNA(fMet)-specific endonuclease VapC